MELIISSLRKNSHMIFNVKHNIDSFLISIFPKPINHIEQHTIIYNVPFNALYYFGKNILPLIYIQKTENPYSQNSTL